MDFWRTILVLFRRKSVVLSLLVFTLGLGAATYVAIPTTYLSTATVVLTTSTSGGTLTQDPTHPSSQSNPLFILDGMKTAASLVILVLNSRDVADQLGAVTGGATTYTVSDGSATPQLLGSSGPFIVIEGHSTAPGKARSIIVLVEQRLRDELINQQRALKAPPATFIGMIEVVPPSFPEAQNSTKLEATVAALVLGLVASTSIAYLVHNTGGITFSGSAHRTQDLREHNGAPTTQASSTASIDTESRSTTRIAGPM